MLRSFLFCRRIGPVFKSILLPTRGTFIVERVNELKFIDEKEPDLRRTQLDRSAYVYTVTETDESDSLGEIEVILCDYVEGVGHKGEVVTISRELAYYELFPAQLAVYVTPENLKKYEEDRKLSAGKEKVSPYATKLRDVLEDMLLKVPVKMDTDWTITKTHIRLALRKNGIFCAESSIELPDEPVNRSNMQKEFKVRINANECYDIMVKLLANPVYVEGTVVRGFGRGSKDLGIPTANLDESAIESLPSEFENGVYYGWSRVDFGSIHRMVLSVGFNPQFKGREKTLEVHILHEFSDDFYGQMLRVLIIGYIRPMATFTSIDELIKEIHNDINVAKRNLKLTLLHPLKSRFPSLFIEDEEQSISLD